MDNYDKKVSFYTDIINIRGEKVSNARIAFRNASVTLNPKHKVSIDLYKNTIHTNGIEIGICDIVELCTWSNETAYDRLKFNACNLCYAGNEDKLAIFMEAMNKWFENAGLNPIVWADYTESPGWYSDNIRYGQL